MNLSNLIRQMISKHNEGKISLKYENDDVYLVSGTKGLHIFPTQPEVCKRSSVSDATLEYATVDYTYRWKMPRFMVDWLAASKTFTGKEITKTHLNRLLQRGTYSDIQIDVSDVGKIMKIEDLFENKVYHISCKSFGVNNLNERYKILEG